MYYRSPNKCQDWKCPRCGKITTHRIRHNETGWMKRGESFVRWRHCGDPACWGQIRTIEVPYDAYMKQQAELDQLRSEKRDFEALKDALVEERDASAAIARVARKHRNR